MVLTESIQFYMPIRRYYRLQMKQIKPCSSFITNEGSSRTKDHNFENSETLMIWSIRQYIIHCLALPDPSFLFFNLGKELLVGERLVQFLTSSRCHLFQLRPCLVQKLQTLNIQRMSQPQFTPTINLC